MNIIRGYDKDRADRENIIVRLTAICEQLTHDNQQLRQHSGNNSQYEDVLEQYVAQVRSAVD